jgi:casein kinase II subunit beta
MCENQNVIPVGLSTDSKLSRVKIYCPRCRDIYNPKKKFADVDGSFFGPSFPYLLIMTYPDLGSLFKKEQHVATMFGFRVEEPNPERVVRLESLNQLKNVNIPDIFNQEE